MLIPGRKTRAVLDRYNIVDERDLSAAAFQLERYIEQRKPAANTDTTPTPSVDDPKPERENRLNLFN